MTAIEQIEYQIKAWEESSALIKSHPGYDKCFVSEIDARFRQIAKALALLTERCEWKFDLHHGMWDTGCGNAYCTFEGDTLKQHGIKGCPFCIRPIKEIRNEQST